METVASAIKGIHILTVLFILFGWVLPKDFLMAHLVTLPIVMLHWWTNKGECILTQMENRLRGKTSSGAQGQFVSGIFKALKLNQPSDNQLMLMIYGFMLASGITSCYRLGLFS